MKNVDFSMKNPLGMIALFVTFIDGIAGLIISVNFEHLHGASERLPLIWFIVLFPIFVLIAFLFLVIKCPEKLYSPKDYGDSKQFLLACGKDIKPHKKPKSLKRTEKIPVRRKLKRTSFSFVSFSNDNVADYPLQNVVDAALQRYSDNHAMEIKTEVKIGQEAICDGVAEKNGEIYLFEVKINYRHSMFATVQQDLARISRAIAKDLDKIHVVLVLVSEEMLNSEEKDELQAQLNALGLNVEIVNYVNGDLLLNKK